MFRFGTNLLTFLNGNSFIKHLNRKTWLVRKTVAKPRFPEPFLQTLPSFEDAPLVEFMDLVVIYAHAK